MGKSSTFIMDDISIFDNPANINLYPNFLIGELGSYESLSPATGTNQDPLNPWFGGIFSLNLDPDNSLSIAGVLNRRDERLLKYFPTNIDINGALYKVPTPVTNFDGFLGANFGNKAFGLHIYVAHQDGLSDDGKMSSNAFASALQLDAGTNIEISNDYSLEVSGGAARIQFGSTEHDLFDPNILSIFFNIRMFSRLPAINGHLIPVASFRNMNVQGRDEMDIGAGLGVDAAFDRGFFWLGLKGFYNEQSAGETWTKNSTGESTFSDPGTKNGWGDKSSRTRLWQFGGTLSFGIERNIWWDWFVLRVGGQKTIAYADYKAKTYTDGLYGEKIKNPNSILCPAASCEEETGNYFVTNPVNDGTRDDHVGFGFGINIEEKLKIDFTVAEDLMFRNPFQGEGRLISRVSATYSF
jgi:hypothetical protein